MFGSSQVVYLESVGSSLANISEPLLSQATFWQSDIKTVVLWDNGLALCKDLSFVF